MEAKAAGAAEFEKPRGPRSGDLDMAMGSRDIGQWLGGPQDYRVFRSPRHDVSPWTSSEVYFLHSQPRPQVELSCGGGPVRLCSARKLCLPPPWDVFLL